MTPHRTTLYACTNEQTAQKNNQQMLDSKKRKQNGSKKTATIATNLDCAFVSAEVWNLATGKFKGDWELVTDGILILRRNAIYVYDRRHYASAGTFAPCELQMPLSAACRMNFRMLVSTSGTYSLGRIRVIGRCQI